MESDSWVLSYGEWVPYHAENSNNKDHFDLQDLMVGFGKEWRKYPAEKWAQKHPEFATTVKNLCKWVIKSKLDMMIDAVIAYICNKLWYMQLKTENITLFHQVKKDNRKRAIFPPVASLPKVQKKANLQRLGGCKELRCTLNYVGD